MCDISEAGYENDEEFAVELARRMGVGGVPGSCFFNVPENRFIRFHFAKSDGVLNDALQRLEGWQETGDEVEQGAFARAAGAEDGKALALRRVASTSSAFGVRYVIGARIERGGQGGRLLPCSR